MYKVFFNDSCLHIIPQNNIQSNKVIEYKNNAIIQNWITHCQYNSNPNDLYITHENIDLIWNDIVDYFPILHAAGGLVKRNDTFLFIFRRGKWDLPKGKVDPGEKPEETALREVEEETGLINLKLVDFLTHTYHLYWLKDHFTLKQTHWFLMYDESNKLPEPQITEDIEKAEWYTIKQFYQLKDKIFGTIYQVIEAFTSKYK